MIMLMLLDSVFFFSLFVIHLSIGSPIWAASCLIISNITACTALILSRIDKK